MDTITEDQIIRIADETADRAVRKFAFGFGINASEPIEVQKDMAFLRKKRVCHDTGEPAMDKMWVRKKRTDEESQKPFVKRTFMGAIIVAAVSGIWTIAKGVWAAIVPYIHSIPK